MDDHAPPAADEALAQPTRASIVRLLTELKRPARTDELAERLQLHPNGIRLHLERLRAAEVVERTTVPGGRGRPRYEWALAADPTARGEAPTRYRDLARWLARSSGGNAAVLDQVEDAGRQIGRDSSPELADRAPPAALRTVLTAFGFQPAQTEQPPDRTLYVLRNCPYRDVVRENQPVICTLHRGITQGLLERLAPDSHLTAFVPKDPDEAGCLIEVAWQPTSTSVRPDAAPAAT